MPETTAADQTAANLPRAFEFNGASIADPDDEMTPDEVRQMLAGSGNYPTLTNASVTGPVVKNGKSVYTFKAAIATKG